MTEMEKMEAMKRAYAEMILNTAKEAAARVMAAELRARRTEKELVSVKEDAANMLLRLKQMIDMKTKEAEVTSLDQKNKFEELESQLNEAESIILDLREELNQGQEQLDRLKKNQVVLKRENEQDTNECRSSGNELLNSSLNPGPESSTINKNSLLSDWSTYEQGSRSSDVEKLNQSEKCANVESVKAAESTSVLDKNIQYGNSEAASIVRRSVRKRKLKFWDDIIAACGLQFKKPRLGSADLSCLGTRKMKRCVKYGEDLAESGTKIDHDDAEVSKELVSAEALPENMELIDVLVKQDDLAANFELSSASEIECDVENGSAAKASNRSCGDGSKLCKYTFNRRWRKKSVIYPEKVLDRGS